MKRSSQLMIHTGILITCLLLASAFFFMGCSIKGSEQVTLHILPWAVVTILVLLCNEWLSGKNLPANLLAGINAVFTIASGAAGFYFLQSTPSTVTVHIFQFLFPASLTLAGFYLTWFPEKPQSLVLCFDSLIGLFLLYLFLDLTGILQPNDSLEYYFLSAIGIVLLFIILIRISSDEERTGMIPKGFFPVIVLIAGCLLLALAFSLLIWGQVKSLTDFIALILKTIILGIFWILGKIADFISTFFEWLMNLLPDAEPVEGAMEIPDVTGLELEAMEEAAFTIPPAVAAGVLIAAAIIGIFWLTRHLKGRRMMKKSVRKASGRVRRIWQSPSLRDILQKIYQAVRFRVRLFRKRKTPAGLVYRIEQYGRLHGKARMSGESAPAYLRRLSMLPDYTEKPDIKQALTTLADLVQKEYYAGYSSKVSVELYQQIKSSF